MQTVMKPNLYAILDMIPEIDTNGSIQRLKQCSKGSPTSKISPKELETVQTIEKGVKFFKNLKNFYK